MKRDEGFSAKEKLTDTRSSIEAAVIDLFSIIAALVDYDYGASYWEIGATDFRDSHKQ